MSIKLEGISTIILDIEGTLCPIWFVSRVLYPYATANLAETVTSQWDAKDFEPYKAAFPESVRESPEAVIEHCRTLAAQDVKDPAWKKLQGLIWRQGYADGVLAVPLFEDVAAVLKKWHKDEFKLAIFSSGSVEAQKLFFRYVDPHADLTSTKDGQEEETKQEERDDAQNGDTNGRHAGDKRKAEDITDDTEPAKKSKTASGKAQTSTKEEKKKVQTEDLNSLFSANFDTINAGPKIVAESYEKIAKELEKDATECLFLSDNVKEVVAAKEAGMQSLIVDRPGNGPLSAEDKDRNTVITSLEGLNVTKETTAEE